MKKLIALLLAMAFVVAACSSSTEDTVETYCDDLGTLKTSLQDLTSLSAQSTMDDVDSAKKAVSDAYDATVSSADAVDSAVASELETARNTWQSAVDGIPSDATVEEAMTTVTAADEAFLASVNTTHEKVDCSS
jgi:PBP1b-binding outer membrane lipoprotein LpoB